MPYILRFAFMLDALALWCEHMVPFTRAFLPLGGDHFTQLAAFVLAGAVVCDVIDFDRSKKDGQK